MLSPTAPSASCARINASACRSLTDHDTPPAASCGAPASLRSAASKSGRPSRVRALVCTTAWKVSFARSGSCSCLPPV
jgi:hypothetical protein